MWVKAWESQILLSEKKPAQKVYVCAWCSYVTIRVKCTRLSRPFDPQKWKSSSRVSWKNSKSPLVKVSPETYSDIYFIECPCIPLPCCLSNSNLVSDISSDKFILSGMLAKDAHRDSRMIAASMLECVLPLWTYSLIVKLFNVHTLWFSTIHYPSNIYRIGFLMHRFFFLLHRRVFSPLLCTLEVVTFFF